MSYRIALACSFVFSLASGGCNAVLGIEEAHDRGSLMSNVKQAVPSKTCDTPRGECSTCLSGTNAFATCLTSHDCREALNDYRECLGSSCSRAGCLEAMEAGAGKEVAPVIAAECPQCEDSSSFAGICDLYCSCMEQTFTLSTSCATFVDTDLPWKLSGDGLTDRLACKAHCMTLDLTSAHCRWSHCELANNGESASHCQHAVSELNCPQKPKVECQDLRPGGWGCTSDQQCCSKACNGKICAED